jgi:SIR2-like domain
MSWERVQRAYRRGGIVLVLGSGVSFQSGLPDWNGLLDRLAVGVWGDAATDVLRELRGHNFAAPVLASVMEGRNGGKDKFVERVREALYRDFPFFPSGVPRDDPSPFVAQVQEQNATLRAVASMCAIGRSRGYAANPRIRAVVTFNLDSLLQAYVANRYRTARGRSHLLRTVERPSAGSNPRKISMYHMHGFLRFDSKARDRTKEAPDAVVLTEQDYFEFFNDPMSLFNYVFMYLLRESTCLFIGLSMYDENIRRMLHFSVKERVGGYEREGVPRPEREKIIRHFAVLKKTGSPHVDAALEGSLLNLGTDVLWISGFDEIPHRLGEVYEAGGDRWELVS